MKIYFGVIESDFDEKNSTYSSWSNVSELQGWGKRYKVRIPGIHSEDKNVTPSKDLPIAEVIYPVTAGTGHDACYQTDALRPGSTVIVLEDDSKRLFITGCKGNNEQVNLFRGDPSIGFIPYSLTNTGPLFNFSQVDNAFIESSSNVAFLDSWSNFYALSDGQRTSPLQNTTNCDQAPLGQIQIILKNFIRDVNEAKLWLEKQKKSAQSSNAINYFNKTIDNQNLFDGILSPINQIYSFENWISTKIQNTSKSISKFLKDIINKIEKGVTNLINDALKDVYYLLFPKQLQEVKKKVDTANDLISCLFRKIIRNLMRLIAKFLQDAVNQILNPVICIVENFIGGILGKIVSLINSALQLILQPLNAVLGIIDIAQDILSIVEDILTTLSCDEKPSCSKIQEWSVWDGAESIFIQDSSSLTNVFNKIKSFTSSVQSSIDFDDLDLNFDDVFQNDCNTGLVACGPPQIQFLGGGGSGASGNPIVNTLGQIIGVDITNFGSNYSSAPIVKFVDQCGKGSGAIGRAILGTVSIGSTPSPIAGIVTTNPSNAGIGTTNTNNTTTTTTTTNNSNTSNTTTGVINVIIEDPGQRYLPTPDGSFGGNGLTIIEKPESYSPNLTNEYSVVMKLCEIIIDNGGFGYTEMDQIIISPSNGSSARPYFTEFGSVYKIDIISKGEGFTELPSVTIRSQTGYNVKLIPRLCAEKIVEPTISFDKVLNVVDCPGK